MVARRLTFGWEKLETLLAEPNVRDLIQEYWEELWSYKDIPCEIDWPRLLAREVEGVYRVWTARVDGTLAGFAAFYVEPYVLARTTLFAIDGGHFLSAAFRDKGMVGFRMWKTAAAALKAEGVQMAMMHDNAARPLLPFFLALGAEPRSTWYWWDLR